MLRRIMIALKRSSLVLARANSRLLFLLAFFLIITPIGLLFRLFGNSVLRPTRSDTLWTERHPASDLRKPF